MPLPAAGSVPSDRVATARFLDGVVLYDGRTGRLFQLSHSAADAWRSLQAGDELEAIAGRLTHTHGIDPAVARRDLESFVEALRQAGLLGPAEAPAPPAAEPRAPRRPPALDATYRIGGIVVRVTCHPADIAAAFAPLAAPAAVPAGAAQARLTLCRERGAFSLTCDDRLIERLDSAPAARWALVRELVSGARWRPWLALLHGGAIASPTGCLLLCGDSGAGKSTLLAGLVHSGFAFVADDILPLERGSRLVWPVPLAMSIKQGSWPAVGELFPELAGAPTVRFGGRTMRFLWPAGRPAEPVGRPAAAVLFPRYAAGAPPELHRLDPVSSLALLGEGGSILPSTDAGLAEFFAWWADLPAYRLSYGRLDQAVFKVRDLIDRLTPGPHRRVAGRAGHS